MYRTRRRPREDPEEAAQNALVIGGSPFGLAVVSSDPEALLLGYVARRELDTRDVVAGISDPTTDPAFEGTGVDYIDLARLLAEQIRDRNW